METKKQVTTKAELALEKITEILKDFNCSLKADILVTEKGNFPRIFVVEHKEDNKEKESI